MEGKMVDKRQNIIGGVMLLLVLQIFTFIIYLIYYFMERYGFMENEVTSIIKFCEKWSKDINKEIDKENEIQSHIQKIKEALKCK